MHILIGGSCLLTVKYGNLDCYNMCGSSRSGDARVIISRVIINGHHFPGHHLIVLFLNLVS